MRDPITLAAVEHCWQQEQWAHAEFYYRLEAHQRADLAAPGRYPWRGIMSPSLLALIEALEQAGAYSAESMCDATRDRAKFSPYRHSPYDYDIARRVEGENAERKWKARP